MPGGRVRSRIGGWHGGARGDERGWEWSGSECTERKARCGCAKRVALLAGRAGLRAKKKREGRRCGEARAGEHRSQEWPTQASTCTTTHVHASASASACVPTNNRNLSHGITVWQPVRHGGGDPRVRPNNSAATEVQTVAFFRSARDVWPLGKTGGPYRRAGARPMEGVAVEQPTSSPRAAQATTVRPARRASVGGGRGPREAISVRPGRRPMGGAQPACTVVRRFPHQNAEIRTVSRAKHGARLRTVSDRLTSRPRLAPPAGAPLLRIPCGRRPRRAHGQRGTITERCCWVCQRPSRLARLRVSRRRTAGTPSY